jgi:hypothetical protein
VSEMKTTSLAAFASQLRAWRRQMNWTQGIGRWIEAQGDVGPHQRQCLDCIAADFRRLGHDPLDITAFRSTTTAIMCRCLKVTC